MYSVAKALRRLPATKPICMSVINVPLTRNASGNAWGMGGGLRWGGMGSAESSTITNGMLAVDFYDPASKQLIWRGTVAQTLNPSGNQEKDMKRLNKAVLI
jgi:Domain of unknown function (DUF4136)